MFINEFNTEKYLLSAVNIVLESIGELPLEQEDDIDAILEARIARNVIIETKMEVLAFGWDVNTDTDYTFNPDNDGHITIPPNVLDIRSGTSIIVRGWQLYDKENKTRVFDSPVSCDVKWNLDFNEIPHALRHYITIKAGRKIQARIVGDSTAVSFTKDDEASALILARKSEGYTGQYNMLSGVYGTQFNVLG